MAHNTSINLRNEQFYQVFVRQFSKTHDFTGVQKELPRIKALGTTIIQLVPFHEIGIDHRKGTIGSPYSIKDYYTIDELNGTMADFQSFLEEAHKLGIKVIMDIVFNHTSHDSRYSQEHPDWFYHDQNGNFCNRIGDWWDIIDFKFFGNTPLQDELIEVLKYWTRLGIDGFRCDVAPLLPIEFWRRTRQELEKLNPNLIYVSESVHKGFIKYLRDLGYEAMSDSEIYEVFDICYDYDIFPYYEAYAKGEGALHDWVHHIIEQESIYPKNYVKLRYLENHDMPRAAHYFKEPALLRNFNALLFFLKGVAFIYNGQEVAAEVLPNLFEIDEIDWCDTQKGIAEIITKMSQIKKKYNYINDIMEIDELSKTALQITYRRLDNSQTIMGVFNLQAKPQKVILPFSGINLLTNQFIDEKTEVTEPIIIIKKQL